MESAGMAGHGLPRSIRVTPTLPGGLDEDATQDLASVGIAEADSPGEIPIGPVVKGFPSVRVGAHVQIRFALGGHGLLTTAGRSYLVTTPEVAVPAADGHGLSEPVSMTVAEVGNDILGLQVSENLGSWEGA